MMIMKKLLILFFAVIVCSCMAAGIASAAESVVGSGDIGSETGSSLTIATSSNVEIYYNGVEQGYGAAGQHKAGNRCYGTGNLTPGIFYKDKDAGIYLSENLPDSTFTGTDWTAQ